MAEIPEEIIAIFPDQLAEALNVVKKLPIVTKASRFSPGLRVVVPKTQEAEPVLHEALKAVRRLQGVAPTLEPSFL